ncbi:MAG: hypothetical protein ABFD92_11820 [Planctomycetaceae bacterium]|nr:hypothetical protein [Planctomycetaceae bacterium]
MKLAPVAAFVAGLVALAGFAIAQPPPPPVEQPVVLTRGPVHEAFAEPVSLRPQAGLIVPNQPPPSIEEIPPLDRPQGPGFVWIPGYWNWDTDRNDFIWVSACWRQSPPNRYWVPGYWAPVYDPKEAARGGVNIGVGGIGVRVGGGRVDVQIGRGLGVHVGDREAPAPAGWEWISGFWASLSDQVIEYLPAPPPPFDLQAPGRAPAADAVWVPGIWRWEQGRYVRRGGYWLRQQRDWVWVPSHYNWTPRGYVFTEGYWDYPLQRRGVLFAPVYFPQALYRQRQYSYSPSIAIDLGAMSANLFASPRYRHYYFGDYYADAYTRQGIYPLFQSDRYPTWYDPIYVYDRWRYESADRRWREHRRELYERRRGEKDLRPPRTYRDLENSVGRMPPDQRREMELAKPLGTVIAERDTALKYGQMKPEDRRRILSGADEARKLREERGRWEAPREGATGTSSTPPDAREAKDTPEYVHPRSVGATQPERVKIVPPRATAGSSAEPPPPPNPAGEHGR